MLIRRAQEACGRGDGFGYRPLQLLEVSPCVWCGQGLATQTLRRRRDRRYLLETPLWAQALGLVSAERGGPSGMGDPPLALYALALCQTLSLSMDTSRLLWGQRPSHQGPGASRRKRPQTQALTSQDGRARHATHPCGRKALSVGRTVGEFHYLPFTLLHFPVFL